MRNSFPSNRRYCRFRYVASVLFAISIIVGYAIVSRPAVDPLAAIVVGTYILSKTGVLEKIIDETIGDAFEEMFCGSFDDLGRAVNPLTSGFMFGPVIEAARRAHYEFHGALLYRAKDSPLPPEQPQPVLLPTCNFLVDPVKESNCTAAIFERKEKRVLDDLGFAIDKIRAARNSEKLFVELKINKPNEWRDEKGSPIGYGLIIIKDKAAFTLLECPFCNKVSSFYNTRFILNPDGRINVMKFGVLAENDTIVFEIPLESIGLTAGDKVLIAAGSQIFIPTESGALKPAVEYLTPFQWVLLQ